MNTIIKKNISDLASDNFIVQGEQYHNKQIDYCLAIQLYILGYTDFCGEVDAKKWIKENITINKSDYYDSVYYYIDGHLVLIQSGIWEIKHKNDKFLFTSPTLHPSEFITIGGKLKIVNKAI